MKQTMYSVFDKKGKTWNNPMLSKNETEMIRSFTIESNREDSFFYRFPADYDLYELGTYDETNAGFDLHEKPIFIVNALDVVQSKIA